MSFEAETSVKAASTWDEFGMLEVLVMPSAEVWSFVSMLGAVSRRRANA